MRLLRANCRRRSSRAFDSWFSDSDPSVWIIQQLNIEAAVNVAGEPEQISRALGAEIARCLSAALQEGNQDNVRHFRNRAEYLASFLSDLASGSAWNQWYYESFGGLKPLPVPAALRTAVCNDVATGKMALSLLSAVELQQVLNELTPQDARRILERFAEDETAVEEALCREAVAEAMAGNLVGLTKLADESRRALYLFIVADGENNPSWRCVAARRRGCRGEAHGSLIRNIRSRDSEADRGVRAQRIAVSVVDGLGRSDGCRPADHRIRGDFFTSAAPG